MSTPYLTRIYVAGDSHGRTERLVRATRPAEAGRHVTRVRLATQSDLERLLTSGVRVENAHPSPEPETPDPMFT